MGLPRLPDAWRILREVDLQAIRRQSERQFQLLVVGDTLGEAARVAVLLTGVADGSRHPWIATRPAEEVPREAAGLRVDALITVTRSVETPIPLAEIAEAARAGGAPVVSVVWGASGPTDGIVRRGEAARVSVPALDEESTPALAEALYRSAEPELRLALARNLPPLREAYFGDLIEETAKANAMYAFTTGVAETVPVANVPLNMADIVILTKNQLVMSYRIALAAGKRGTPRELLGEVIGVIGGGFLLRQGARSLVGLVPGMGILPKVVVAYAGTWAIGRGVAAWAGDGRRLSSASLGRFYAEAWQRGRTMAESLGAQRKRATRLLPFQRRKKALGD
jgi:uncharacterized protein (DUF697 family)